MGGGAGADSTRRPTPPPSPSISPPDRYADLHTRPSESRSLKLVTGLSQARGRWRGAFSLGFQREGFTIGLDDGTSKLLMPQPSWSLVQADDRIYTTHGQRVQLDVSSSR